MFKSLFQRTERKPKIEGYIGYYGLADWWLEMFTEEEREYIDTTFSPMGADSKPLTTGKFFRMSGNEGEGKTDNPIGLLYSLAGWLKPTRDIALIRRILEKGQAFTPTAHPLDVHFLYQHMVKYYYPARDMDPNALHDAIDACEKQIACAAEAAEAFREDMPDPEDRQRQLGADLPAHIGYKQLAIIREKEGNYTEAIRLCKQAKEQGWNGDWDKRIARCESKLTKAKK